MRGMPEIWLRRNLRLVLPFTVVKFAVFSLMTYQCAREGWPWALTLVVGLLWSMSLAMLFAFWRFCPLLAYADGCLYVSRGKKGNAYIPIEYVEGFLLGQGPSYLPGKKASKFEVRTLVVRLAERAEVWEQMPMTPSYGNWCHHYITFRGTYCEPLSLDLVNRLNARLYEVQQAASHQKASV
jgi:hypothetical protein